MPSLSPSLHLSSSQNPVADETEVRRSGTRLSRGARRGTGGVAYGARRLSSKLALLFAAVASLLSAPSLRANEPAKAILILDASGSMWGQIDGVAKIEIAREAVARIVAELDEGIHLGLMAYGHRQRGECEDIELLIEPGQVDKAAMIATVNSIIPRGRTPLTASILQAAEVLRYGEDKATVILVSDGIETCDMDPCAATAELAQTGIDFTAHVIGFDLADEELATIRCIAENTGGEFLAAADGAGLGSALASLMAKTADPELDLAERKMTPPEPVVEPVPVAEPDGEVMVEVSKVKFRSLLAEGGEEARAYYTIHALGEDGAEVLAGRGSGPTFDLAPGSYRVHAKAREVSTDRRIEIPNESEHEVDLVLNAGLLRLKTLADEGGEEVEAYYTVSRAGVDLSGKRPRVAAGASGEFLLPAGEYHVEARWGDVRVGELFEVTPNEVTDGSIVAGAGVLRVEAVLGEGGEEVKAYYTVYSGQAKIDGSRDRIAAGAAGEFRLPAGRYFVEGKWGNVTTGVDAEVKPGEATQARVVLDGGMLRAVAKDADGEVARTYFSVYSARVPLSGTRTRVSAGSTGEFQIPVGDYVIEAKIGEQTVSAEATVKAGEATEVTLQEGSD